MNLTTLIKPANKTTESVRIVEHAADPIKDVRDVVAMTSWMREHGKWRDQLIWVLGINTGLRVSDLLRLRWGDLVEQSEDEMVWRDEIVIQEKKTANTKKRAVNRHIAINESVREAAMDYLRSAKFRNEDITLDTYLFRSESNNGGNINKPMHRNNVESMLKKVAKACDIKVHVSCHTMRKTYAYHTLKQGGNDQRQLILLQKMMNHSSVLQTLTYAGVTQDEMKKQYSMLNLGFEQHEDQDRDTNVVLLPLART